MKKVNIQFFATLEENLKFVENLFTQKCFNIILRASNSNISIDENNIDLLKDIIVENNKRIWYVEIYFLPKDIDLVNLKDLKLELLPNTMFLNIGEQNGDLLRESWLATSLKFTDKALSSTFFKIGQKLKRETKCGGYLVVENKIDNKFRKTIRYTEGALKFNKMGGKVHQGNPNLHFILGSLDDSNVSKE